MQALYSLALVCILCACAPEKTSPETVAGSAYFPISINDAPLKLQLALTRSEHAKGLMYRDALAEDHGMLFLFKRPERRSFWMRNTQIPLDLAYFDSAGTLLEVHPLYPYDENSVYSYSHDVLIAIETNQGWFSQKNIRPGAQLDLTALKQAVYHRGYHASDYSL